MSDQKNPDAEVNRLTRTKEEQLDYVKQKIETQQQYMEIAKQVIEDTQGKVTPKQIEEMAALDRKLQGKWANSPAIIYQKEQIIQDIYKKTQQEILKNGNTYVQWADVTQPDGVLRIKSESNDADKAAGDLSPRTETTLTGSDCTELKIVSDHRTGKVTIHVNDPNNPQASGMITINSKELAQSINAANFPLLDGKATQAEARLLNAAESELLKAAIAAEARNPDPDERNYTLNDVELQHVKNAYKTVEKEAKKGL